MSTATTGPQSLRLLARNKTEGVSEGTIFRVDPNLIKFEKGFNLRDEGPDLEEHIERLYQAYKAGDMVPAVDVTVDDKGVIVARDGHCRTKAAKRWHKEDPTFTIECRQFRGNDADAVIHMLNSGTGGMRLTPLQEGRGYLRLLKMGKTVVEIAEARHVSRVTIDNGITLAEAPSEVQKLIVEGKVSSTEARKAVKAGPEGVKALKDAAKALPEATAAPAKNGSKTAKPAKKKKVTAKTLRGTAAERKPKKKKIQVAADELAFTLKKFEARIIADAMAASDDETVKNFVATLETALL